MTRSVAGTVSTPTIKIRNEHVRLRPGPSAHVAVVREIFRLYNRGLNAEQIARRLNLRGIPSPRKLKWKARAVRSILANVTYRGALHLRLSPSKIFPEGKDLLAENIWPPIVSRRTWERAAKQREAMRYARTRESMRAVVARCTATTEPERILDETDDGTFQRVAQREWRTLTNELKRTFSVTDVAPNRVTLNDLMPLSFIASRLEIAPGGFLRWRFELPSGGQPGGVVCLGIVPNGRRALAEMFFINTLRRKKLTLFRPLFNRGVVGDPLRVTVPSLAKHIQRDLFRCCTPILEERLEAYIARTAIPLDLARAGRELGWPHGTVWNIFSKLRARGVMTPVLQKAKRRPVTSICPRCGRRRVDNWSRAMRSITGYCQTCIPVVRARPQYRICPDCGDRHPYNAAALKKLSNGALTRCRSCFYKHRREFVLSYRVCRVCGDRKYECPSRLRQVKDGRCRKCYRAKR